MDLRVLYLGLRNRLLLQVICFLKIQVESKYLLVDILLRLITLIYSISIFSYRGITSIEDLGGESGIPRQVF